MSSFKNAHFFKPGACLLACSVNDYEGSENCRFAVNEAIKYCDEKGLTNQDVAIRKIFCKKNKEKIEEVIVRVK